MGNKVFANTREIACKAAVGKTICAFPDVCFTPPDKVPPTPPGIPIPYPNTGMASDTTKGSKKVTISDKEIILKNKSYFKKSMGDEAGCAQKKGVITSKNTGKVYFQSWSMDVKVEGKNVARHLDMTTNNHGSMPGDTPPWLYTDKACTKTGDCDDEAVNVKDNCTNKTYKNDTSGACCEAKKCVLAPKGSQPECCDGKTKHHVVPDHCFKDPAKGKYYKGFETMTYDKGACLCVHGKDKNATRKQHARIHADFDDVEDSQPNNKWSYGKARKEAARACAAVTGCNEACLDQQIKQFNKTKFGFSNDKAKLRADSGSGSKAKRSEMGINAFK